MIAPKIVIERKREFANRRLPYDILLDDKKIGVVPPGRTVIFDVPSGRHKLQLKIDWTGTKAIELDLHDGDVKTFVVSTFRYSNVMFAVGGVAAILGIVLRVIYHSYWIALITAPFGLLFLYYITFGRLRYLRLEEKQD